MNDFVDKAEAWDAAQSSFRKGHAAGIEAAAAYHDAEAARYAKMGGLFPQASHEISAAQIRALTMEDIHREQLARPRLKPAAQPASAEPPNFAQCCSSTDIAFCDCVNKNHIRVNYAPSRDAPAPSDHVRGAE